MADEQYVITRAMIRELTAEDLLDIPADQVVRLAPGMFFVELPLYMQHRIDHLHDADDVCLKRRAGDRCDSGPVPVPLHAVPSLPSVPHVPLTPGRLLSVAADLLSVDGENPEYDRAIVELTGDLLGFVADEYPLVRLTLHSILEERKSRT